MQDYILQEAIPDQILERGFDYYENGNVIEVEEVEDGEYTAVVQGMEVYTVYIKIVDEDMVAEHNCTCPYDWGVYCKHFVAVVEAMEAGEYTAATDETAYYYAFQKLKNSIEGMSKQELKELILAISKRDKSLQKTLIYWLDDSL
ncbi:MAG: SWIM zinc finger domain-containing protein [Aureispira sp.]